MAESDEKLNSRLDKIARDVITFVDDVRMTGSSKENCHGIHRQFSSQMQWMGIQDAPRKFGPPSQLKAGAWTRTTFKVSEDVISISGLQEKWEKGKKMVERIQGWCNKVKDNQPI